VAKEEVRADSCGKCSRDQGRVRIRLGLQDLERCARCVGGPRQIARRRVHGDRGEEARAEERVGRLP